jgi:hypothetical protein
MPDISRDILAGHGKETGHAVPCNGLAAVHFFSGPGDSLLASWRNG